MRLRIHASTHTYVYIHKQTHTSQTPTHAHGLRIVTSIRISAALSPLDFGSDRVNAAEPMPCSVKSNGDSGTPQLPVDAEMLTVGIGFAGRLKNEAALPGPASGPGPGPGSEGATEGEDPSKMLGICHCEGVDTYK